jgi:hypothetical protein
MWATSYQPGKLGESGQTDQAVAWNYFVMWKYVFA